MSDVYDNLTLRGKRQRATHDAEGAERDRVRFEALVAVVREMAFELRSRRNDVEQIKAAMLKKVQ